jgi:hypothetical protein
LNANFRGMAPAAIPFRNRSKQNFLEQARRTTLQEIAALVDARINNNSWASGPVGPTSPPRLGRRGADALPGVSACSR